MWCKRQNMWKTGVNCPFIYEERGSTWYIPPITPKVQRPMWRAAFSLFYTCNGWCLQQTHKFCQTPKAHLSHFLSLFSLSLLCTLPFHGIMSSHCICVCLLLRPHLVPTFATPFCTQPGYSLDDGRSSRPTGCFVYSYCVDCSQLFFLVSAFGAPRSS